ncbi:hypothetical protein LRH25_24010 [Ideonella azotifigens]|uniref:hypothetical protein n=1 Tax=Ideonella azotifigens TaxID=513160 RepID=UPI0011444225|nr:hypothetical protein [Ideonella azotifigens]MCD2343397.1 hypothetical protein [Ideonella azotifigens]
MVGDQDTGASGDDQETQALLGQRHHGWRQAEFLGRRANLRSSNGATSRLGTRFIVVVVAGQDVGAKAGHRLTTRFAKVARSKSVGTAARRLLSMPNPLLASSGGELRTRIST